jgi:hypothetical protein
MDQKEEKKLGNKTKSMNSTINGTFYSILKNGFELNYD